MSWDCDPLWAKSRLFFSRAIDAERDDPVFGLWCSFGLELLARAAVASVSPTLLAQPDREQKNLLHVVHRGSELAFPQSIPATRVVGLCARLFTEFTEEDAKAALALFNCRNAELHSGTAAFEGYRPGQWLASFYHACGSLAVVLGESLETLLGEAEAEHALRVLAEDRANVQKQVFSSIAAYKKVFEELTADEQTARRARAEERGRELSTERHHRVTCPACGCVATVQGRLIGKEHVTHEEDGDIVVRQAVSPTDLACSACGLAFTTYAQLEVAGLADQYTRTTTYSPEEYYGLVDPDNLDFESLLAEHYLEYDNE